MSDNRITVHVRCAVLLVCVVTATSGVRTTTRHPLPSLSSLLAFRRGRFHIRYVTLFFYGSCRLLLVVNSKHKKSDHCDSQ
jgi:hypothetical protein